MDDLNFSDYISNMSHKLHTPLNGILEYTQILKRKHDLELDMVNGLEIIEQCGYHAPGCANHCCLD